MPFVKKMSVNRHPSGPPPSLLRHLSDSNLICTFADVKKCPALRAWLMSNFLIIPIMSKGNMLLGHARGKVGDLVFSRSNGEQIVRARAAVVKNPQTRLQMIQRVIMATVMRAYSVMQPLADHSFEGVQAGQKSMSRFMAANINALRSRITSADPDALSEVYSFTPLGTQSVSYNSYILSSGSLPGVTVTLDGQTAAQFALPVNTYRGVIDHYGLQEGDQLTFVNMYPAQDGGAQMGYCRVILSPSDGNLDGAFIADGSVLNPNVANEGVFSSLVFEDGTVSFRVGGSQVGAAGVIVSRRSTDNTWRRSNCQLVVGSAVFGYSMWEALVVSENASLFADNPLYLNNANTQTSGAATVEMVRQGGRAWFPAGEQRVSFSTDVDITLVGSGLRDSTVVLTLVGSPSVTLTPTFSSDGKSATIPASQLGNESTFITVKLNGVNESWMITVDPEMNG